MEMETTVKKYIARLRLTNFIQLSVYTFYMLICSVNARAQRPPPPEDYTYNPNIPDGGDLGDIFFTLGACYAIAYGMAFLINKKFGERDNMPEWALALWLLPFGAMIFMLLR